MEIKIKLDITQIQNDELYIGRKGVYLNAVLLPHKEGKATYDDGFILQQISKEGQTSGKRSRIVGFWRNANQKASKTAMSPSAAKSAQKPYRLPFGERVCLTIKGKIGEYTGILELEDKKPDSSDVLSAKLRIGDVIFDERELDSLSTLED